MVRLFANARITTAALAAACALLGAPVHAQQPTNQPALATRILREDGTWEALAPHRTGFNLFAESDLAGTSLKLTGKYRYAAFNAGGLCAFAITAGDFYNSSCGQFNGASTYWHVLPVWGAPPSAYLKIRAVWPGIADMQQPIGYSTPWRRTDITPLSMRIGPADHQFGNTFSGIGSADGTGCRDMSGAQGAGLPKTIPLMPASDCPETWGSEGFRGMRTIPDSIWLQHFRDNQTGFRWSDWQIPASELGNAPTIGDLSTYGSFSDFGIDILTRYGNVTPKGPQNRPTSERGFPLGIEVRYDAFKFDRASLSDGVFVRWLVVNKSADVWGTGIDYDSLYMGIDPSYILGGDQPSGYNVPSLGLHIATGGGLTAGRCTNAFPRRMLPGVNEPCGGSVHHFALAMILKSPIGDLRNKLFTNAASPFYSPANPKADDTLTFNHWAKGGFGGQDTYSWRRSDRSLFGLISGREDLWLDGRDATEFSAVTIWNYFRYEFTDGKQSAANLRYNRSAPGGIAGYGKWDYNDDGVQDTLFLPDCGTRGCAALWSDSIAGGFANRMAGNIGNYLGVGPFSLKAGDTTEFFWYLGASSPDTISANTLIRSVTDAYMNNFNTFAAPTPPVFAATDVQLTSAFARDTLQTSEVRIRITMPPLKDDAYLMRMVARLKSNEPAAVELRNLNPGIVAAVEARMHQNLARLLVFKSCDRGAAWTDATGTCESAATARVKSSTRAGGWQPFREITADTATGALQTHVLSDVVQPGREYLYSFVTESRSLANLKVVFAESRDATGVVTSHKIGTLSEAMSIDVDSVMSHFETVGPTTVRAYAPVSVQPGTIAARVDTATLQGQATNPLTVIARSPYASGQYRMRFGNRFVFTRTVDTVSGVRTATVIRQSVYARAATNVLGSLLNFVASADTFAANHDVTYTPGATLRSAPRFTAASLQTYIDTLPVTGYVIARSGGTSEPLLLVTTTSTTLFASSNLAAGTDRYEGSTNYPGFTATVANVPTAPAPLSYVVMDASGATLNATHVDSTGVSYRASNVSGGSPSQALGAARGGTYRLEWLGDAFGPRAPFAFGNAEQMEQEVTVSLATRPAADSGDVDGLTRALIAAVVPNAVGNRPLVQVRVPFRIIADNGKKVRLAMVMRNAPGAADSVARNSRLFGTKGDTTRVYVRPDVWVPGDTLYVVEDIETDSTVTAAGVTTSIVRDTTINGRVQTLPIRVTRRVFTATFVFGCASNVTPSRITCNPVRPGPVGATDYLPYKSGFTSILTFNRPFDQNSEVLLTALPTRTNTAPLTQSDVNLVHVVPNPFVVASAFDQRSASGPITSRVLFVNVPTEGLLRIYTISGQMVQQLSWTSADLVASGDNSSHGDLPYNLRTREGRDLASGVYLFVLTAKGANANGRVARGKFVVIR